MRLIQKYPELEAVIEMKESRKPMVIPKGIRKVVFVSANPADRHLLQVAVEELAIKLEFVFLKSAEEFQTQLEEGRIVIGTHDILFVDYFLPRKSGLELLQILREDERFAQLPILMMVPAMFDKILIGSYQEGANCCILMPVDYYELITTLKGVLGYWNYMLR
ncbi:MAG: hypothetical protein AAFN10_11400 [Bacteroidota bacterium]